jgi:hypothetical protein
MVDRIVRGLSCRRMSRSHGDNLTVKTFVGIVGSLSGYERKKAFLVAAASSMSRLSHRCGDATTTTKNRVQCDDEDNRARDVEI